MKMRICSIIMCKRAEQTRMVQQTDVNQRASSVYNNYKTSFPVRPYCVTTNNVALNAENIESHLFVSKGGKQVVNNHTIVDYRKTALPEQ